MEFSKQVRRPFHQTRAAADVPQAALDVRGLESLRRALAAAVRSFGYAAQVVSEARPSGRASNPREPLLTRGLLTPVSLAAFIAGLIEGGFPLRTSRDWLYPHEERVRLQKHGIFLEDISTDTLLKEEHYFYQAACRATERLYLPRPRATSAASETVASYYIEELKRAIDPNAFETVQIRGDLDTHELAHSSTASEFSTLLIRHSQLRDPGIGAWSPAQIKDLLA